MSESAFKFTEQQQHHLDNLLINLRGFYLPVIGADSLDCVRDCPVMHKFLLSGNALAETTIISDMSNLPFSEGSCDVILFDHLLEQTSDVALSLASAYTSLRYGGYLLLTGYNPCRFRARKLWQQEKANKAHKGEMQLLTHLRPKLEHAGFCIQAEYHFGFWQSNNNAKLVSSHIERWGSLLLPALTCGYLLLLQKTTPGVSSLKPAWLSMANFKKTTLATAATAATKVSQ